MSGARSMVRGAIDGCVSILGVVIGAYGTDTAVLLSAALAGNLANSMANLLAALSAESTQQAAQLRGIEQAMLVDLHGTILDRSTRWAARWAALTDSMATLVGGFVPVLPFLVFPGRLAPGLSIAVSLLVLLWLGAWIGRVTQEGMFWSAVRLLVMGLLTVGACYLIRYVMVPTSLASPMEAVSSR